MPNSLNSGRKRKEHKFPPAKNLRRIRIERGLSAQKLEDICGVKQRVISAIECGSSFINNITLATAYKLANALDCSIEDLMEPEPEPAEPVIESTETTVETAKVEPETTIPEN